MPCLASSQQSQIYRFMSILGGPAASCLALDAFSASLYTVLYKVIYKNAFLYTYFRTVFETFILTSYLLFPSLG